MRAVAILVAAGSGERLGADRPKAFVMLAGRELYLWSLDALSGFEEVVLAVPAPSVAAVQRDVSGRAGPRVTVVAGGRTRSESVLSALGATVGKADAVVVHDAARPLAPPGLFDRCLQALEGADAAIAAARLTDTVKEVGAGGRVERTLDRSRLWAVQTPQAFRRAALERAFEAPAEVIAAATDDAWLVERAGGSVVVVEAPPENLKVTTPHDLAVAEMVLGRRAPRPG